MNNHIQRNTNENIWLGMESYPGPPASVVRCSTTEILPPLLSPHAQRHTQQTPQVHPVRTYSVLNTNASTLNREGHSTNLVGRAGMNIIYTKKKEENIWLDWESNPGPMHH